MERLGHGREGYEENHGHGEVNNDDHEEDHKGADSEGYDEDHEEDDNAESSEGAVEHQAEYAAEHQAEYAAVAGAESDLAATQFGYRSQARLGRREGTWVPVDTRGVKAPVFVPLDDLFLPWHIPGPSDKKKRLPGPDADTLRLIERIYEAL